MASPMPLLALVRDAALLGAAATLLGALSLAARVDAPWTPPPPVEAAMCGADEEIAAAPEPPPALRRMSIDELRERLPEVVLVDARSADAFGTGHLPGAVSLPADIIDAIVSSESLPLPVDRDIVTYCDREGDLDAQYVGRVLDAALGCDRIYVLDGGVGAWTAALGPIEATTEEPRSG